MCVLLYDLVVSYTKRPEALKRKFTSLFTTVPQIDDDSQSTAGLTVSSLLCLLVYLSHVSVFVSTFSTRGGLSSLSVSSTQQPQPSISLDSNSILAKVHFLRHFAGCSSRWDVVRRNRSLSGHLSEHWAPKMGSPFSASFLQCAVFLVMFTVARILPGMIPSSLGILL